MKKFFKFWFPVIIWAGFIFVLSSIPDLKTELKEDFILRKIAHILEYAILTYLLIRAFQPEADQPTKVVGLALIFTLFYALTDEYHQTFVLGREGSLRDVGVDGFGILLVALLWYYKSKRTKGRNKLT